MPFPLLIQKLLRQDEGPGLDFKKTYSGKPVDYLHDILSMMNLENREEKYLMFGVDDDKKIVGLESEINDHDFNNFLAQASLNIPFSVKTYSSTVEKKTISILIIPENEGNLYAITHDKYNLYQNRIYTRTGSVNTGKNSTAHPDIIKKILLKNNNKLEQSSNETSFRCNYSADNTIDVHQQFFEKIQDYSNWDSSSEWDYNEEEHITTYFYKNNTDFQIKEFPHMDNFSEPWSRDAPDQKASAYELKLMYKGLKIATKYYALTDGARYYVMYPEIIVKSMDDSNIKVDTWYYYYIKNTLNYNLSFIINLGRQLYLNRMQNTPIPVFESQLDAQSKIDEDFQPGMRKILSYSYENDSWVKYPGGSKLR